MINKSMIKITKSIHTLDVFKILAIIFENILFFLIYLEENNN